MAMLGCDDYLCEACKHFDTDGIDGNHPRCRKQSLWSDNHRAFRLGEICPYGYEYGVPIGYPVNMERNKKRAHEIGKRVHEIGKILGIEMSKR